jgi:hypothetical protein
MFPLFPVYFSVSEDERPSKRKFDNGENDEAPEDDEEVEELVARKPRLRLWHDNRSCGLCPQSNAPLTSHHFKYHHKLCCPVCLKTFPDLDALRLHFSAKEEPWIIAQFGLTVRRALSSGTWYKTYPVCPHCPDLDFFSWKKLKKHFLKNHAEE